MREAVINGVIEAQWKLIAALDAQDIDAIFVASDALANELNSLRGDGVWHSTEAAQRKIELALKQTMAARMRVNYLANWARQKIEMLKSSRSNGTSSLYQRPGKLPIL